MKKFLYKYLINSVIATGLLLISLSGCTDKGAPSLFQGVPTGPIGATPSITSISPSPALSGVTQVTITGQNFSTNPSEDLIYFNGNLVTATSATPTQLVLTAPNVFGDSVQIQVAVLNAEKFSNTVYYSIEQTAKDFYPDAKSTFIQPFNIISDNSGNIYSSVVMNNVGSGIKKITPDSVITDYAAKGAETFWKSFRFGPGGIIVCVRQDGVRALYQIPAGGGSPSSYVVLPAGITVNALEYDSQNNLWVGGKGGNIYRVKTDKSFQAFAFAADVITLRDFKDGSNEYLYAATQTDTTISIQRFPIDANGNLGTAETYFNFTAKYGANYVINAMDISADGDLYLATNLPSPIIVVHSDKTSETLYPGVVKSAPALAFAWGGGTTYLYYVSAQVLDGTGAITNPQDIVRLQMKKTGAPYYGQ